MHPYDTSSIILCLLPHSIKPSSSICDYTQEPLQDLRTSIATKTQEWRQNLLSHCDDSSQPVFFLFSFPSRTWPSPNHRHGLGQLWLQAGAIFEPPTR